MPCNFEVTDPHKPQLVTGKECTHVLRRDLRLGDDGYERALADKILWNKLLRPTSTELASSAGNGKLQIPDRSTYFELHPRLELGNLQM